MRDSFQLGNRFHHAFLTGFLLALPSVAWLLHHLVSEVPPRFTPTNFDSTFAAKTEPSWLDSHTLRWSESKKNRQLWATATFDETGISLRAFENEKLFHSLYPGYPLQEFQTKIVPQYFSKSFDQRAWIAPLAKQTPYGAVTYRPSTACVSIFKNFGADILIFGDSTTMRALELSMLSQQLSPSSPARVLSCATGGMLPETMQLIASDLSRTSHRVKWVVVDINRLPGYPQTPGYLQEIKRQAALFLEEGQLSTNSWIEWMERARAKSLFPSVTWDVLFPANLQKLLSAREGVKMIQQPVVRPDEIVVPTSVDGTSLAQWAKSQERRTGPAKEPILPCPTQNFSEQIDSLVGALTEFSENILLWIGPTTPLYHYKFGSCSPKEIQTVLESRARGKVQALTVGWKTYDLNYQDFLFERSTLPKTRIDIAHVNFEGAKKITQQIVQKLKSQPGTVVTKL